jgi:hypothetical protein
LLQVGIDSARALKQASNKLFSLSSLFTTSLTGLAQALVLSLFDLKVVQVCL